MRKGCVDVAGAVVDDARLVGGLCRCCAAFNVAGLDEKGMCKYCCSCC
jgi:hypothetical protein